MSNANALPIETPNLFSLSGGGLTVSLALSGFDGKPHFSYQDSHQSLNFSGDDITIEETALATLVTVTLVRTPDFGDTTFTLLVPGINLLGATSHVIHTVGITTMHRTTIAGLGHGQLTTYHVTRLSGSAAQVQF
ncbi:MAG TPA: hypothetical protein VFV73_45320 [Streptosporangiaceae bacterium]|nr:hypothetical protein [Streptosporangiaceae bacterium]